MQKNQNLDFLIYYMILFLSSEFLRYHRTMKKVDFSQIKTAKQLNELCKGTFVENIGIEMINVDEESSIASMDISSENMMAPNGYVHGGVISSLAETTCGNGTIIIYRKVRFLPQ